MARIILLSGSVVITNHLISQKYEVIRLRCSYKRKRLVHYLLGQRKKRTYSPYSFKEIWITDLETSLVDTIQNAEPDIILMFGFAVIPASSLKRIHVPFVNLHPSLLPAYRGADPLFWQVWNNESIGDVTAHFVTAQVDTGSIVGKAEFSIPSNMTLKKLRAFAENQAGLLAVQVVRRLERGVLKPSCQPVIKGTWFPRPVKKHLLLTRAMKCAEVQRLLTAFKGTCPLFIENKKKLVRVVDFSNERRVNALFPQVIEYQFADGSIYLCMDFMGRVCYSMPRIIYKWLDQFYSQLRTLLKKSRVS